MHTKFSNYEVGGYRLIQEMLAALDDNPLLPWTAYPCLEWPRGRYKNYGALYHAGRMRKVHRVAYEVAFGPYDPLLDICHHCDNPPCFRPSHLFEGNAKTNAADMVAKKRHGNKTFPGAANWAAKLTEAEVLEIRRLRAEGTLLRVLSARFHISETQVSGIAKHKSWTHI